MKLLNKFLITLTALYLPMQNALAKTTEQSFVVQKFAIAIALVIFFAAVLYGVLFLYKKFFVNQENNQVKDFSTQEKSLASPKDLNEAIATFLEKTKPNQ